MTTYIMIPCFNEAANIGDLIAEIRRTVPEAGIVVVDDNSPDGTAAIVEKLSEADSNVHLLLRTTEKGRGTAGRDGFKWALAHGAERVVEMDADFSHNPKYLPQILAASENADVVLGSRYTTGGCETNRSFFRQAVTKFAAAFLRRALDVKVHDPSSGFRCFKKEMLEKIKLDQLMSTNFSITPEILYKCRLKGATFAEVPIIFEDRTRGYSKLTWKMLFETLSMVMRLNRMHRAGKF